MKKNLILLFFIFSSLSVFAQYDVKTINRPDGITMKYFNPIPVSIGSTHEAGLSLYKNTNTKQYFLTLTVLFKKDIPTELSGKLLIQTNGKKAISLIPVFNKKINMNGREVATSMFQLTNNDIKELKKYPIKLISFNVRGNIIALNLNKNKNLIMIEFTKL